MKVTKSQLIQLIKEETQGEMEFAELEAARQAYLQEPNDDTKHELGLMINKLVEPIMAKMGLWWEAEAYYSVGQLVFSNHKDMEVIIDPRGSRGGYDLKVSPLVGAEDDFEVIEDTFGSMKGVTQFIYDLENPHADGMVGEPESQTELPFGKGGLAKEHKMKITKQQLRKIIKEETQGEMAFAPLEAARQAYLQEPNDDTKHELGQMINKLVEPLMAEMGLFWEAEAYYNVGNIVFNNDKVEITIDPRGETGGYDVNVSAQVSAMDTDPAFEPMNVTLPSMKGVAQYVKDELEKELSQGGTYKQPPRGMVGEPKAQTELPLEHKVKITKSELQKIIKEELKEAYVDVIQSPDYERNVARDRERSPDPLRQIDALDLASHLEERGFALTRGGYNKIQDFLEDMFASGDLRHPMDK